MNASRLMNHDMINSNAHTGALTSASRSQSQTQLQQASSNSPPPTALSPSNRTSPFAPKSVSSSAAKSLAVTTTAPASSSAPVAAPTTAPISATNPIMATSILHSAHPLAATHPSHHPHGYTERDGTGTSSILNRTNPIAVVRIDGLAANADEEYLRNVLTFSNDVVHAELVPLQDDESPTRSAMLRLQSVDGALEIRSTLHGKKGIAVDIVSPPSYGSGRSSSGASSATSPATAAKQAPRFDPTPPSARDKTTSPTNGNYVASGNSIIAEPRLTYRNPFSPQSPVGNHLVDHPRVTGKSLINDADDDDTGDILKDPRAYVDSAAFPRRSTQHAQRRATVPVLMDQVSRRMGKMHINNGSNGFGSGSRGRGMYQPHSTRPNAMSPSMNGAMGQKYRQATFPGQTYHPLRAVPTPANPADQNPPCNTLYVGNLPMETSEDELRRIFTSQRGYRRMCFRAKGNGPMCFVEFDDISTATKALKELYGVPLSTSKKGGIRLSFSKNPLGVRNTLGAGQGPSGSTSGPNCMMASSANGYTSTNFPPGLVPPGLVSNRQRSSYTTSGQTNGTTMYGSTSAHSHAHGNGSAAHGFSSTPSFNNNPWVASSYFSVGSTTDPSLLAGGGSTQNGCHPVSLGFSAYSAFPTNGSAFGSSASSANGAQNGIHHFINGAYSTNGDRSATSVTPGLPCGPNGSALLPYGRPRF